MGCWNTWQWQRDKVEKISQNKEQKQDKIWKMENKREMIGDIRSPRSSKIQSWREREQIEERGEERGKGRGRKEKIEEWKFLREIVTFLRVVSAMNNIYSSCGNLFIDFYSIESTRQQVSEDIILILAQSTNPTSLDNVYMAIEHCWFER